MTQERERRRSVRVTCTEAVEGVVVKRAILFRGRMRDVSETGCYVETSAAIELEPGQTMELRFRIGRVGLRVLAQVVQMTSSVGIRMRFIETSPRLAEAVRGCASAAGM